MTKEREVLPEATSAGCEDAARKTPMGVRPDSPKKKTKARKGEE